VPGLNSRIYRVATWLGIAVGAVWEVLEWTFGFIGPIPDTAGDLILDGLGAFAAAWLATYARDFEPPPQARSGWRSLAARLFLISLAASSAGRRERA
jgi:hypothetical protein